MGIGFWPFKPLEVKVVLWRLVLHSKMHFRLYILYITRLHGILRLVACLARYNPHTGGPRLSLSRHYDMHNQASNFPTKISSKMNCDATPAAGCVGKDIGIWKLPPRTWCLPLGSKKCCAWTFCACFFLVKVLAQVDYLVVIEQIQKKGI